MWHNNHGQAEDEILRNRFTAYLLTAIQRRRKDYLQHLMKNMEVNGLLEPIEADGCYDIEDEALAEMPLMMKLENQELLLALQQLGERERYVLLNRALEEKSFEMLSLELGLTYKGVSAIYYRAVHKVKKRMRGGRV
jgi:RNA polymerase sigma factor (sigma-70 family)